jgi:nucleoside-diphosphate-sugar epimerase
MFANRRLIQVFELSLEHPCEASQALLASQPYGSSKVAYEALKRSYIAQFEIDAVALRVSIAYGNGRQTYCGITRMLHGAVAEGVVVVDRDNGLPSPWIYVDDLVGAVIAALTATRDRPSSPGPGWARLVGG